MSCEAPLFISMALAYFRDLENQRNNFCTWKVDGNGTEQLLLYTKQM